MVPANNISRRLQKRSGRADVGLDRRVPVEAVRVSLLRIHVQLLAVEGVVGRRKRDAKTSVQIADAMPRTRGTCKKPFFNFSENCLIKKLKNIIVD